MAIDDTIGAEIKRYATANGQTTRQQVTGRDADLVPTLAADELFDALWEEEEGAIARGTNDEQRFTHIMLTPTLIDKSDKIWRPGDVSSSLDLRMRPVKVLQVPNPVDMTISHYEVFMTSGAG